MRSVAFKTSLRNNFEVGKQVILYAPEYSQTLLVLLFVWFLGFAKFISGNSLGGMVVLCSGKIHLWIFGLIF